MAPTVEQTPIASQPTKSKLVVKGELDYAKLTPTQEEIKKIDSEYEYDYLLPSFPNITLDPIPIKEEVDKASLADPNNEYANLFRDATSVVHVNSKIGTEVIGVDLSTLDETQKNELALLIARRVVVVFRNQEELTPKKQIALGEYFGTLHVNANTPVPKGAIEDPELLPLHVVHADVKRKPNFNSNSFWHSDVSYEKQPASYTSLKLFQVPSTGGDTLFSSSYGLYDALSPGFRAYLETLKLAHTSTEQGENIKSLGFSIRRDHITSIHPLVRTHPVTGWKYIFANKGFSRDIVGIPKSESDAILSYLYKLNSTLHENIFRAKWNPNDVVLWDNRTSTHSAVYDFYPETRHGIRVTTQGEVPYFDPSGKSQQEEIDAEIAAKLNSTKLE